MPERGDLCDAQSCMRVTCSDARWYLRTGAVPACLCCTREPLTALPLPCLQVADQAPGMAERAGGQLQDAAGSATDAAKQGASQASDAMQVRIQDPMWRSFGVET